MVNIEESLGLFFFSSQSFSFCFLFGHPLVQVPELHQHHNGTGKTSKTNSKEDPVQVWVLQGWGDGKTQCGRERRHKQEQCVDQTLHCRWGSGVGQLVGSGVSPTFTGSGQDEKRGGFPGGNWGRFVTATSIVATWRQFVDLFCKM